MRPTAFPHFVVLLLPSSDASLVTRVKTCNKRVDVRRSSSRVKQQTSEIMRMFLRREPHEPRM
jgi:hypothetical protein